MRVPIMRLPIPFPYSGPGMTVPPKLNFNNKRMLCLGLMLGLFNISVIFIPIVFQILTNNLTLSLFILFILILFWYKIRRSLGKKINESIEGRWSFVIGIYFGIIIYIVGIVRIIFFR